MNPWIRAAKWIVPVFALFVLMALPSVADARGGRWSGIDPVFYMNGHQFNVTVEWPAEHTCDLDGVVEFKIRAPGGEFEAESRGKFDCDDGDLNRVYTQTRFSDNGEGDQADIKARLRASASFPVIVTVHRDGELVEECEGVSNRTIRCEPVSAE
jgi:hypothetical protein